MHGHIAGKLNSRLYCACIPLLREFISKKFFLKGLRVWVAPIVEKMLKTQFRWFGNEERSLVDSVVKKFNQVKLVKSLEE